MDYVVTGDSLIENYNHNNVDCYSGMTLEHFVKNIMPVIPFDDTLCYFFCFGLNDLSSGINEDEVINNYNVLIEKYLTCVIILPPFQTDSFYQKCSHIDSFYSEIFITDYNTVDGVHPDNDTLDKLKDDIIGAIHIFGDYHNDYSDDSD